MHKIISNRLLKLGQSFLDELEDVEWDGGHGKPGIIDESNYEDVLADEREKEEARDTVPEKGVRPDYEPEEGVTDAREIPYLAAEGKSPMDLIYDGIDEVEVIEFGYTTRHGVDIGIRRVEPHYTFVATKPPFNEVLVTHDKTIGIDESKGRIRSFIIGNIHPDGVRYKNWSFDPRGEIMGGVY